MTKVVLRSTVVCPYCGVATTSDMPTNACVHFWDCPSCDRLVKPKEGDCCVFCSYGDVDCPSKQV